MTAIRLENCVNDVCPWTGRPVSGDALTRYKGRVVGFADRAARDAFLAAMVAFETAILAPPEVRACAKPLAFVPRGLRLRGAEDATGVAA